MRTAIVITHTAIIYFGAKSYFSVRKTFFRSVTIFLISSYNSVKNEEIRKPEYIRNPTETPGTMIENRYVW